MRDSFRSLRARLVMLLLLVIRTRRLPVVVLTSSTEDQDLAMSYNLGVNSYIPKPVSFEQFAGVVEQLGLYWLVLNESPPEVGRQ